VRGTSFHLPGHYYTGLARILIEHLPDLRDFTSASGLDLGSLDDPDSTITLAQLDNLIEMASTASGCAHLGLKVGKFARLTGHGPLGYALLSSSTLEELVRLAARYYHLIVPAFTMRYARHCTFAEITFTPTIAMKSRTLQFFVEALAVAFQVQLEGILGPGNDDFEIHLSTDEPLDVRRYLGTRFTRYHFGKRSKPGVTVMLAASLLDKSLPMADRRALRVAEAQCEARSRAPVDANDVVALIEMMLSESANFQLTKEDVATAMNVTLRTLNRYLGKQGETFKGVCQRIRFAYACRLLAEGRLNVTQIAARTGFSNVGNFSRGFRDYVGVCPTRYAEAPAAAPHTAPD
jgi:AraC-like DNA-binding protein